MCDYIANRKELLSCRQDDLSDVGSTQFQLVAGKTKGCLLRFKRVTGDLVTGPQHANATWTTTLRANRCTFTGQSSLILDKYFSVLQIKSAGADMHTAATAATGDRHTVRARTDKEYGLRFVLDHPIPRQIDCRPWRCLTCKRNGINRQWSISYNDIRSQCPDVLRLKHSSAFKEQFMTRTFVLHLVEFFSGLSMRRPHGVHSCSITLRML